MPIDPISTNQHPHQRDQSPSSKPSSKPSSNSTTPSTSPRNQLTHNQHINQTTSTTTTANSNSLNNKSKHSHKNQPSLSSSSSSSLSFSSSVSDSTSSSSPSSIAIVSVLDWNESQVNQFFVSLGLNRFENAIRDHGVTGDVLIHLDNELLKDMGIQSVGNRLAILRAIYKLKLKQDIPIEDGHWVPPLGGLEQYESDINLSPSTSPRQSSLPPHPSIDKMIEIRDQKLNRLESEIQSIKSELQSFAARLNNQQPSSSSQVSDPLSPNIFDSQLSASNHPRHGRHLREQSINQLVIPDSQSIPKSTSPVSTINSSAPEDVAPKAAVDPSPVSATPSVTNPPEPSTSSEQPLTTTPSAKETLKTITEESSLSSKSTNPTTSIPNEDSSNPYRSFKVTLEDPCYKVLPAALKKYKIKEHYKNYVLFICYGKQERCLSYDDKPLLLFQKLKEAQQNPVFTLRHIKDIESPISIALNKQNQRREKAKNAGPESQSSSSKKVPSSFGSVEQATGFCISIYPYISDVGEGFDVGVGDTFLIVGKSKGWWVVVRDYGNNKDNVNGEKEGPTSPKKGFIPSGCLIETSKSFASNDGDGRVSHSTRIESENILSVSSTCQALMDYKAKNTDELSLEYGDRLRVYKKYNNWSFGINESKEENNRGWAPSWLIGNRKDLGSSSSSNNNSGGGVGVGAGVGGGGNNS